MKHQADKNHSDRTFQVGDWVFLKLQPYVQSSLAPRANQKLAFKFFGPYKIISEMGSVAYKLDLPDSSNIHDVFHVSQLKKAIPSSVQVTPSVPDPDSSFQFPERILDRKLVSKGVNCAQHVLVKWSGWPKSLASWEDLDALRQRFPNAPAWGQAGFQRGGMLHHLLLFLFRLLPGRLKPTKMGLDAPPGPSNRVCALAARNGPARSVLAWSCT